MPAAIRAIISLFGPARMHHLHLSHNEVGVLRLPPLCCFHCPQRNPQRCFGNSFDGPNAIDAIDAMERNPKPGSKAVCFHMFAAKLGAHGCRCPGCPEKAVCLCGTGILPIMGNTNFSVFVFLTERSQQDHCATSASPAMAHTCDTKRPMQISSI